MYYPYKEALYEEIIKTALNAVTEGFKPLITSAPDSWHSVWKEYLQNVLTALYQVKSLFSMIPPGSEAFCAFVASLTDKIISYIDRQVLHLYHIHENNKIKIYATNRIMLSGMINEVVYCLVNTDYSIEFIQHLITPLFLAYCKEIENICAGEPPKD